MANQAIIVERLLNAPASKVWNAITDREEMKDWYFNLEEFKAEPGFRFQFPGGPSPEKQYLHLCEITEVIPESKITYSWKYDGYTGISFVNFELFPDGERTLVKLTHTGLETFPPEIPDFERHNFEAGWDEIINSSLKNYLEGGK